MATEVCFLLQSWPSVWRVHEDNVAHAFRRLTSTSPAILCVVHSEELPVS